MRWTFHPRPIGSGREAAVVVVGSDGGAGGEDALELGRLLASALGIELLPVSVIVTRASPRARAELERTGQRMVVAPSVALGLSDVARETSATAVIVGSGRHGRIARALHGTGITHLAEKAPCPVGIAPAGYARRYAARLAKVEVSFDGSAATEDALDLAARIAAADRGRVHVRVRPELRGAAEQSLARAPGRVVWDLEVDPTEPAEELEELRRRGGDMLIVGRTGAPGLLGQRLPLMIL